MYSNKMALAQYKKIDNESAVNGASPHKLIEMLMKGALDRMAQAKAAFEAKNIEQKGVLLGKSISIIAGLQASLDNDKGADVAANLDKLYDYMQRRLLEANLKNDMAMVEEVSGLLLTVKSGWDSVSPS
jgi:flagellar secretion chaperone FliS